YELMDLVRVGPEVASVQEHAGLEQVGDRDPELDAGVQREIAAADGDVVDGEALAIFLLVTALDLVDEILRDHRVCEEAPDRVAAAEEEKPIRVGLAALGGLGVLGELEVIAGGEAEREGELPW